MGRFKLLYEKINDNLFQLNKEKYYFVISVTENKEEANRFDKNKKELYKLERKLKNEKYLLDKKEIDMIENEIKGLMSIKYNFENFKKIKIKGKEIVNANTELQLLLIDDKNSINKITNKGKILIVEKTTGGIIEKLFSKKDINDFFIYQLNDFEKKFKNTKNEVIKKLQKNGIDYPVN